MDIAALFGVSFSTLIPRTLVLVYWRPPPVGWVKINTDECVRDSYASGDGIIRNHRGSCIQAFSAELRAILQGVELARQMGLGRLWIEVDSSLAVHCITRGGGPWNIQILLRRIRHLLAPDIDRVSHIFREGNQVADYLASEGWEIRHYQEYGPLDLPRLSRGFLRVDRLGQRLQLSGKPLHFPYSSSNSATFSPAASMEEQASSNGASSSSSQPQPQLQPSLDDCLKLLRGERDEQRLAGLLLVTKFCNKDDHAAIHKVYDAVGPQFLHRLLRTGKGKGSDGGGDNRDAYLQLSITVLATFCRVPQIAASEDMITKIPLIVETMSREAGSLIVEECYEFLFLVSMANEEGVKTLYKSGGLNVLASQMMILPDGSHMIELAMRLVQIIVIKLSSENVYSEHPTDLSMVVAAVAKQFAVLQNALKFEALHLLSAILLNGYYAPVYDALRLTENDVWSTNMRIGIVAILQNRVAPSHKLQALALAECVISIIGEGWLIGEVNLTDSQESLPADRCILLVLESSRVEIAVLLNDLAYLKYEASKESSNRENILAKQRNLGVAFSLVEQIIKLISSFGGEESTANAVISESTFTKIISGLNETIGVVLDYLLDTKEHGQMKGDDLLAAVRVIGSYLAEAPDACKDKVTELLGYMISIEGEDELSPFYSICFLLPMLCQITLKTGGCKILASSGAFRGVVGCLIALIDQNNYTSEDNGSIFLACDIILNLFLKREQIKFPLDDPSFIRLLVALSHWAEGTDDASVVMMASSICSLILDLTSEDALLNHPDFTNGNTAGLSKLIGRSFVMCGQDLISADAKAEVDLFQIIISAYSSWADRFPGIRRAVESSGPFPF